MIKKKITTETKQRIFTLRSEGLTVKEISEKYNISKSTIYSILAGRYDSHLSKLSEYRNRRNYRASPFQILDIIGNMREATVSDIIIELECHYREQKSKYESVLRTLKQLVDDEIIIRAGKGGKWDP